MGTETYIPQSALRDLLSIINNFYDSSIPLDPRTLCNTPVNKSNQIKHICGGTYFHFGEINALIEYLQHKKDMKKSASVSVYLKINCDGIPLFKSSSKQFWPILIQFSTERRMKHVSKPFPVGIFLSDSKPYDVAAYLEDFLTEINILLKDGYEYKSVRHSVTIHSFVCDAPVRSS